MKMERNEHGCPVHGNERYSKMDYFIVYRLRNHENALRSAVESGGDVVKAINELRFSLNELEKIATDGR